MNYITLHHKEPTERAEVERLIGKYFESKEIAKAHGRPLHSDDTYTWVVAMDGEEVVGFSALRVAKNKNAELRSAYVVPTHRKQGIGTAMIAQRIELARQQGAKLLRTTIDPARIEKYPEFVKDIQKGKWLVIKMYL